jgi:hypothetical protein
MGGSNSKPVVQTQQVDTSVATVPLDYVNKFAIQANAAQQEVAIQAHDAAMKASRWRWTAIGVGIVGLGIIGVLTWYFLTRERFSLNLWSTPSSSDLSIQSAVIKGGSDITSAITNKISNSILNLKVDETIGVHSGETLIVRYQYPKTAVRSMTVNYGDQLNITPPPESTPSTNQSTLSKWWNSGSRNLLPTAKSAEASSSIAANTAPLSAGTDGAYSYQFWMYIKDWNYKFGKDKNILSRSDATNVNIMNPSVSLHPTDNTMRISISIFPSSSNSSKNEPAPAGHSGSTDDVFICEVPNIPLQSWTCVSISVFSRNLDVYLDGKLVKSCVMSGVPKPAAGDIELNKDGGFSGWMCNLLHYSRMLSPTDCQAFYSKGVPCSIPGTSVKPGKFNVTFGLFDTKGREVSKYMF